MISPSLHRAVRYYARGRATRAWLTAWLATAVILVATAANPIVIPVQFLDGQPTRWTPLWEAMPTLLGAFTGVLIAPQLGTWERRGLRRLRSLAALFAATTLVMVSALPWITHLYLPTDARWIDITTNVIVFTSWGLLTTALLGRLLGGVVAAAGYLLFVAVSHAAPDLAQRLPMAGVIGNTRPHPLFALSAAVIAVTVWTVTLGEARSARSLRRNE